MRCFIKTSNYTYRTYISINSKEDYLKALFILKSCGATGPYDTPWRKKIKLLTIFYTPLEKSFIFSIHSIQDTINWPLQTFIENYISSEEDIYKLKNLI